MRFPTCLSMARGAAVALLLVSATACSSGSTDSPVVEAPTATPTTASLAPSVTPTQTRVPSAAPSDPLSPKPALESAPPVGQPTCAGSTLTVTDADTLVSPQYKHEVFVIRTSGPPCQLKGYPAVRLLDSAGHQLAVRTQAGGFGLPSRTPHVVTLSRGTSLSFEVATPRDGSCQEVAAIVTTLPGTSGAHRAATSLRVCGATVGLSPVQRMSDAE